MINIYLKHYLKQLKALDKSIKHWKSNVYRNRNLIYSKNCPCCKMVPGNHCWYGCPICDYTGKEDCFNTPWRKCHYYYCNNNKKVPVGVKNRELSFLYEVRRWLVISIAKKYELINTNRR